MDHNQKQCKPAKTKPETATFELTLSSRRSLSYRNQFTGLYITETSVIKELKFQAPCSRLLAFVVIYLSTLFLADNVKNSQK